MNRREFVKGSLALAGAAAFGNIGMAEEGRKKMSKKCMVVYFSWSGNTRFAATTIAKKAGATAFEIKAVTPYNSDFGKCCDEAKPECYGKKLRPIKAIVGLDLAKYDIVFVGSPNWWGTLAPPVRTWLTQNAAALKGKTVCLFQTHGGGGMQSLGRDFAALLPGSKVLPPKAFAGSSIKSSVKALEEFAAERIAASESELKRP
jgi:flavodoxin